MTEPTDEEVKKVAKALCDHDAASVRWIVEPAGGAARARFEMSWDGQTAGAKQSWMEFVRKNWGRYKHLLDA